MENSWKIILKKFDSKPVYGNNDKYIKTKIKIYGGSVNTNFQDKIMPKEKAPCVFVFKKQVFINNNARFCC